jgi:hypothetical protein
MKWKTASSWMQLSGACLLFLLSCVVEGDAERTNTGTSPGLLEEKGKTTTIDPVDVNGPDLADYQLHEQRLRDRAGKLKQHLFFWFSVQD